MSDFTKTFFIFLIPAIILIQSCSTRDNTTVCLSAKCEYEVYHSSFLKTVEDKSETWLYLSENGLNELEIVPENHTPVFYDEEQKLLLSSTMNDAGLRISIIDNKSKVDNNINEVQLPVYVNSILSACSQNGTAWLLHVDEDEKTAEKRFVISSFDYQGNNWESFLLSSENTRKSMEMLLSMGLVVERPVSIDCTDDEIYITTFMSYKRVTQLNVYKFDSEKKIIAHHTHFLPLLDGKVHTKYSPETDKLFVFQRRTLNIQQGLDFPEKIKISEEGELLIHTKGKGATLFFIPDHEKEAVKGRILKH